MAREQRIWLRVTDDERAMMERATANLGLTHISKAIRVLMQQAAKSQSEPHHPASEQCQPDRQPDAPPQ